MGSCISKCCPKSPNSLKHCNPIVQDKLIVATTSTTSTTTPSPTSVNLPPFKKSTIAPYYSPSSSCSTTFTTSSSSSSSKSPPSLLSSPSFSSSTSVSKDRLAFSNEFLWSCAREHPHIISVNDHVVKGSSSTTTSPSSPRKPVLLLHPKRRNTTPSKSTGVAPKVKAVLNQPVGSTPQKRARASSPVLTRQKSFRREPERGPVLQSTINNNSLHRRNLGSLSPTPSRRHSGEAFRGITKNVQGPKDVCHSIAEMGLKRKAMNSTNGPFSERNYKEKDLQQSGSTDLLTMATRDVSGIRDGSILKRVETCTHHVNPGIEKRNDAAGLVGAKRDHQLEGLSSLLISDIDNPLISLDCFIFL